MRRMMSKSKTPLCDAEHDPFLSLSELMRGKWVPLKFAQQLEIELRRLNAKLAKSAKP